MTPQKQTILTIGDKPGNCLTACVASLLDLNIQEVPYFVRQENWFAAMYNWFYQRGNSIVLEPGEQLLFRRSPQYQPELSNSGFVIVTGKSPREGTHAVIYKDGKPFFDPHPDNTFITEVDGYFTIAPKGEHNLYSWWGEEFIYGNKTITPCSK